jgi:hypothetical protein
MLASSPLPARRFVKSGAPVILLVAFIVKLVMPARVSLPIACRHDWRTPPDDGHAADSKCR